MPDQKLHSSYIERINATFRARLHGLVRRGRALYRQEVPLQTGMYLVGTFYNFCTCHASLRQSLGGRSAQVGGAYSGDGGRDHRLLLAGAGVVGL